MVFLNSMGIVCALGRGQEAVLSALLTDETTGVTRLDDVLTTGESIPFARVQADLVPVPERLADYASRNLQLALTALAEIEQAIAAAVARYGGDRVAVVAGSSTSGIHQGELALARYRESNHFPDGFHFQQQEMGTVGESIARRFNLTGPALTISTACSAGVKVFGTARRFLSMGIADAVVVGGVDSFCRMTLNGFRGLFALSPVRCNPFSRNRDGTILGEGGAFFLMTREPGGAILGGIGESSDAYNVVSPRPDGLGAELAMRAAMDDARVESADLQYINLHGTATEQNDAMESRAVERMFSTRVPCSSSKPQVGHTLGAAGAIELGLCWLVLSGLNATRALPPNLWDGCEEAGLLSDYLVRPEDRLPETGPAWCMSNSYAFGGSNACVIIGRAE